MRNEQIERARQNSVNKERRKAIRKRRKRVNLIVLILLITSLGININLATKSNSTKYTNFNEITYGEDYDKEFESTNNLIESYIKSCIKNQIKNDTHHNVENNQHYYYYNFTDYSNVFRNHSIIINDYKMNLDEAEMFFDYFDNLTEEEKEALLIYYGTEYIDYDNNKENFKEYVGRTLAKNNVSEQTIEALAKGAVNNLTENLLDSHWISNSMGRSN